MREFFFVIPSDQSISRAIHPHWFNQNILVSAANYYKNGELNENNHFYQIGMGGKTIIDCGIFEYYSRYSKFPYTIKQYTRFLNKMEPTYGVAMDMICLPKSDPNYKDKYFKNNYDRIDFTVKNCKYNINNAKNYEPMSVIQGFTIREYIYCIEQLQAEGCLTRRIGIGTLAKRKSIKEIVNILKAVRNKLDTIDTKIKLHGFGLSFTVIKNKVVRRLLFSSDSLSWIFALRKFHRVTVYDKIRNRMQEVDIGKNEWAKYIHLTFQAYRDYVSKLIRPSSDFIKTLKTENKDVRFTLIYDSKKEEFSLSDINALIIDASEKGMKKIMIDIPAKSLPNHTINTTEKIYIYNPINRSLLSLPAKRNNKNIRKENVISVSLSSILTALFQPKNN